MDEIPEARSILPCEDLRTRTFRSVLRLRHAVPSPPLNLAENKTASSSPLVFEYSPSAKRSVLSKLDDNLFGVALNCISFATLFRPCAYGLGSRGDDFLEFDAQFESGNLLEARKTGEGTYQLQLRNDFNSSRYRQWFYFQTQARTEGAARFKIINFRKKGSLFQKGMQVSLWSSKVKSWTLGGKGVTYTKNQGQGYSLSFSYEFIANQTVFFAFSLPYTYSQLTDWLYRLGDRPTLVRRKLCDTLMGNSVDLLQIRGRKPTSRSILIIARIHPGETPPSFIVEGLVEALLSSEGDALREEFTIWVVPMLNVDGVILGNYRTSLAGRDLNRKWKDPSQQDFPEIYHLRKLVDRLRKGLALVLDLHAHSKANGIFTYSYRRGTPQDFKSKIFSGLLSKLIPDFALRKCRLDKGRNKHGTARVCLAKGVGIKQVLTLECSFKGGEYNLNFDSAALKTIGRKILTALHLFFKTKSFNKDQQATYESAKQLAFNLRQKDLEGTQSSQSCSDRSQDQQMFKQFIAPKPTPNDVQPKIQIRNNITAQGAQTQRKAKAQSRQSRRPYRNITAEGSFRKKSNCSQPQDGIIRLISQLPREPNSRQDGSRLKKVELKNYRSLDARTKQIETSRSLNCEQVSRIVLTALGEKECLSPPLFPFFRPILKKKSTAMFFKKCI